MIQSRAGRIAGVSQSYFYLRDAFLRWLPLGNAGRVYTIIEADGRDRGRNRGPFWNHARYRRPIVFSTLAYPIPFCPVLTDPMALPFHPAFIERV